MAKNNTTITKDELCWRISQEREKYWKRQKRMRIIIDVEGGIKHYSHPLTEGESFVVRVMEGDKEVRRLEYNGNKNKAE